MYVELDALYNNVHFILQTDVTVYWNEMLHNKGQINNTFL